MRAVGVICEYNPFHRGHARHLALARAAAQADYVVCVMSGPITQRGAFARHDKWMRARAALMGGADLVLELPVRFSCAPAEGFARGGVGVLAGLGVITHLSFGCEPEALPHLAAANAALAAEGPAFAGALREGLSRGLSFPRARAQALQASTASPGLADAIAAPNAALALEYLRALPPQIAPLPIAREGAGYHETALSPLPSATAVRAALIEGRLSEALDAVPHPELLESAEAEARVHPEEALTTALLYRLRTLDAAALAAIEGMDEGLEHRFRAAAQSAASREELLAAVKSKRYTYARLSRLCACILLDLTREFAAAHPAPTYARILGFKRSAAPLLRAIQRGGALPLITKAADFDREEPLFALDRRAQDLWALGCKNPRHRAAGQDFTTSPVIL